MKYARNYLNTTGLADRIRESAGSQKAKPAGGLAGRIERAKLEDEDFELIRARYINDIRDMFSGIGTQESNTAEPTQLSYGLELTPEDYGLNMDLEEGPTRPRRNPKNFDTGNLSERDLLALTLQAEAGGEGALGMLAAGAVIANRVNTKGYGNSIPEVILAPGQFSAWNSLTGYAGGEGGIDMSSLRASETAYEVADLILSGDYESPVGGATHYYNPNVANPVWGERGGGQWQTIGNHVFGYGN